MPSDRLLFLSELSKEEKIIQYRISPKKNTIVPRYLFIYTSKIVFDSHIPEFLSFVSFKKQQKSFIAGEYEYQGIIEKAKRKSVDDWPNGLDDLTLLLAEECIQGSQERIKEFEKNIRRMEYHQNKETNLERIKKIPITDFIKFNKARFAECIWHSEKTPSLHYYPRSNTVYCFSCNKSSDIIGVVQKINNYSFIEALKFLS